LSKSDYSASNKEIESTESVDNKLSRRRFINILQGIGVTAIGSIIWAGYVDQVKSSPLVLRPPGALDEKDFLTSCIKCGLCVQACQEAVGKEKYPLQLATPDSNKPTGTPYFIPRDKPCIMCIDVPCVPPCPTGALSRNRVTNEKTKKLDINLSKMGLAVVDEEHCIAFWGIQCDVCVRVCPLIDKAIKLEYKRNERTGKHAFLTPVVNSDYCTGCGICEARCVTEKAAIYILPRELAQGKVQSHYVKNWEKGDELRIESTPSQIWTETERSKKRAVDTLNEGIKADE